MASKALEQKHPITLPPRCAAKNAFAAQQSSTNFTVKCWGQNDQGQNNIPLNLGPVTSIIAVGASHSCVITAAGTVRCWSVVFDNIGRTAVPSDLGTVKGLYAGPGDHTCTVKTSGTVVCWGGNNYYGQLDVPSTLGPITTVAVGNTHNCALDTSGAVACWGSDYYHEATVPADLQLPVALLAAGYEFTCAFDAAGDIRCWGVVGDLGPGWPPVGLDNPKSIAFGGDAACVINYDDSMACWGSSSLPSIPAALAGKAVSSVSMGQNFACARTVDSHVVCWGSSEYNQTTLPAKLVGTSGTASAVSSAGYHSCAILDGGSLPG